MTITYPLTLPSGLNPSTFTLSRNDAVASAMSPFTLQEQVQRHQGQQWILAADYPVLNSTQVDQWEGFLGRLKGKFGTFTMGDPRKTTPSGVATGTPLVNSPGASLTTNGSTASGFVLPFTSTTNVQIGQSVSGTNIAAGSVVTAMVANTSVTLNYAITGTVANGATITFSGMSGDYLFTKGWTPNVTGILLAGDYVQVGTALYRLTADANSDNSGLAALEVWPQVRQNPAPPADGSAVVTTNTVGVFRLDKSVGIKVVAPQNGSLSLAAHEAL